MAFADNLIIVSKYTLRWVATLRIHLREELRKCLVMMGTLFGVSILRCKIAVRQANIANQSISLSLLGTTSAIQRALLPFRASKEWPLWLQEIGEVIPHPVTIVNIAIWLKPLQGFTIFCMFQTGGHEFVVASCNLPSQSIRHHHWGHKSNYYEVVLPP